MSGRHFLFSVGDGNLPFSKYGVQGFVLGAIITAHFGAVINKAVLEIYREASERRSEKLKEISSEVIDL